MIYDAPCQLALSSDDIQSHSPIQAESKAIRILKSSAGFSLIEIIIVLGILGTLIAVLIGGIGSSAEKAKVKSTAVKAGQVQQNLLRYQGDVGKMPTTAEGLASLQASPGNGKWSGPYGGEDDLKDDWGNAFEYELTPQGAKLSSPGLDGQVGTEDDLVYLSGRPVERKSDASSDKPAP